MWFVAVVCLLLKVPPATDLVAICSCVGLEEPFPDATALFSFYFFLCDWFTVVRMPRLEKCPGGREATEPGIIGVPFL